jgi:crotonobetaine/carnitine-CoA ligase
MQFRTAGITGDLGRTDELGGLVYISRLSESVRVKGEFVPLTFVEDRFRRIAGIGNVVIWKRASELVDDELVLFVEASSLPLEEVRAVCAELPSYMRPSAVALVELLPRDSGVGKVRRRELDLSIASKLVEL